MLIVLFKIAVAILLPSKLAQALLQALKKHSSSQPIDGEAILDKQLVG